MSVRFSIPEIIFANQVGGINYNPALAVAVNKLLRIRDQDDYEIALKEATQIAIGYESVKVYDRKSYGDSSVLAGMPLFQPLLLKGSDGVEDLLLESAVAEFERPKNIVTTVVQGRDTSVDEFINNGDWIINISGLLCYPGARYPLDQVLHLEKFMDLNTSIAIEHEVMNGLGIYELVVQSHRLPKTPHINCQSYSISAKSTQPLSLIIKQQPNETIF